MTRRRLDSELVRRGIVNSRQLAQDAIALGRVTVGGAPALKPTRMVDAAEPIEVSGDGPRFVSRGGDKLNAAIEGFNLDVVAKRAIDAGASTGGFTDCLLQHGCAHVIAIDVGYGQLDSRLRSDPRVVCLERTNVRHLVPDDVDPPVDLVVGDLSFIGLANVVPALVSVAEVGAEMVLLVKPQFEAGRAEAAKGKGVIRDPNIWRRVLSEVVAACSDAGLGIMEVMSSPVRGPDGNREFLIRGRVGMGATLALDTIEAVVATTASEEKARR